jgi:hypothetical protein
MADWLAGCHDAAAAASPLHLLAHSNTHSLQWIKSMASQDA